MTQQLNILKRTYTTKILGHCYREENYTILVEGTHTKEVVDDFGNEYVRTHQYGQGNSYNGFKVRDDGNTEVYVSHTIDSSD